MSIQTVVNGLNRTKQLAEGFIRFIDVTQAELLANVGENPHILMPSQQAAEQHALNDALAPIALPSSSN